MSEHEEELVEAIANGVEELKKASPFSKKVIGAVVSIVALFGIITSALTEFGGRILAPQEVIIPDIGEELEPVLEAIQEHSELPSHMEAGLQLEEAENRQIIMQNTINSLEENQEAQTDSIHELAESVNTLNGQFDTFFQMMLATRRMETIIP